MLGQQPTYIENFFFIIGKLDISNIMDVVATFMHKDTHELASHVHVWLIN